MPVYSGTLSAGQIARYAYNAGFRGQALVLAVAIALGESSGKVNALGDKTLANSKWGYSIGLWQIRSLKNQYGSGQARDSTRLRDPAFNARAAFQISGGGSNFRPWTVFTKGIYKRYMGQAQQAAASIAGGDARVAASAGTTSVIGDLGPTGFDAGSAKDRAKSLYGYLGWFVDHPEVGPIIMRAAQQGWDAMRLQGALLNTRWWQRTSESARQFDALLTMDPATAKRRIQETDISIRLQTERLGFGMSKNQRFAMAVNALRLGWNAQELQLAIVGQMRWNPLSWAIGGSFGKITSDVHKLSGNYFVPLTARQAWQWGRRIAGGLSTIDAVEGQVRMLAALRYPHLRKELSRGVTPAQFFAPHRNAIAETLEMSPDGIDFMNDNRWRAITTFRDPKTKKTRPMTVTEAARYARMQPAWSRTDNAWKSVTEAGDAVLQIFGEVAR